MKKLITLLLLSPTLLFSQEKEVIEVYETKSCIKEVFPSKIIENNSTSYFLPKENALNIQIYETNNGVKNIFPTQIIEDNKVYNVVNGTREVFPVQIIETNTILNYVPQSIIIE